jgi:hypothetical protein
MPEFRGVNTKRRKNHIVLHIGGTQRLIVVVYDRDFVLERSHAGSMDYALSCLWPVDENLNVQARHAGRKDSGQILLPVFPYRLTIQPSYFEAFGGLILCVFSCGVAPWYEHRIDQRFRTP